jgi:hypothetical protein
VSETEKLRRVEKFEELRAGDLVVLKNCKVGCGDHRGILTEFCSEIPFSDPVSGMEVMPAWLCDPDPGTHNCGLWIPWNTVAEGRLYLVDTGLEQSHNEATSTKAKAPQKVVVR